MTLFRQLLISVAFSTLLALVGAAVASLLSSRNYLEQQLALKNEDNASALALLMTQQSKDPVSIELYVTSLFDNGHYELIEVRDPHGNIIVQRAAPADSGEAPRWFVSLLPIHPPAGQAQVSDGWKQFGTLTLRSQSKFAYQALWQGAYRMAGWLLLAGIISAWLGALLLKRMRRPLAKVVDQASAICERRFVSIAEPEVPELRQLALAMNTMVGRLKSMFDEEAARLESVRREANYDATSGLPNRAFFTSQMLQLLKSEDHARTGSFVLARIIDLGGLNRQLGRVDADRFLGTFLQHINDAIAPHPGRLLGRLNGSDFALVLPGLEDTEALTRDLLASIDASAAPFSAGKPVVLVGYGVYEQGMDLGAILGQLDAALAEAETSGDHQARFAKLSSSTPRPASSAEWAAQLGIAIKQGWLKLERMPVAGFGTAPLLHQEGLLRMRFAADGEWIPAGHFLPMAARLQKTAELDLAATRLALLQIESEPGGADLAVNLSGDSLGAESFRTEIKKLLKDHAHACRKLWLEVSETGVFAHLDAFRLFRQDLTGSGCRLGIEHFGREFSRIGLLHEFGLHYLKIDSSFIHDIDNQTGNQVFLEGLCQIARSIGIVVIAEGVRRPEELMQLEKLGFDGATGPAIASS